VHLKVRYAGVSQPSLAAVGVGASVHFASSNFLLMADMALSVVRWTECDLDGNGSRVEALLLCIRVVCHGYPRSFSLARVSCFRAAKIAQLAPCVHINL